MVNLPDVSWVEPLIMKNIQWLINISLISLTLFVTSNSYLSQRKSRMRESIEQLHELHIAGNIRIQPLLHRMKYLQRETTFVFKFYAGKEFEGASNPLSADLLPYLSEIKKEIRENDSVKSVNEHELADSSKNLLITCNSTDTIECRRTVEECLSVIKSVAFEKYRGIDEESDGEMKEEIKSQQSN